MGEELASAIGFLVAAIAFIGVAAFFSLWVHRAEGNRALTMGLYIVFGAFGFFVFLFGVGSAYRDYLNGNSVANSSVLAMVVGAIAGIGLIAPLRRLVARVIPFDPDSKPDMIGLILLGQLTAVSVASLYSESDTVEPVNTFFLVLQAAAMVALAFVTVGVFFYRTPDQALRRLGLEVPTGRQLLAAVGLVVVAFAVTFASVVLAQWFQPELNDAIDENLAELTSNVNTVWVAVLLGIVSGVGEETLFRGAIQPRFGIIFTALVFALLHVQYGASFITVGVFAAGVLFGLERRRLNTTCCAITHALYNTIVFLLSMSL